MRRWARTRASSADSGSSSSRRPGESASARATATRCCWPPESCAGYLRAGFRQADELQQLHDARLDLDFRHAAADEAVADVGGDRQVREQRVRLEDDAEIAVRRRQVGDFLARPGRCGPEVWMSSPAIARSSVVLPQPEGPRKQTNSPERSRGRCPSARRTPRTASSGARCADTAHRPSWRCVVRHVDKRDPRPGDRRGADRVAFTRRVRRLERYFGADLPS